MEIEVSIKLKIQAPDAKTGQQMAAAFCEPAIRQITGQQVPKKDGVFDIEEMKVLAASAIRTVFTGPYLADIGNQLEAQKHAALETARQQATEGMVLEVTVGG
jgi:hypothetical protein